MRAKFTFRFWAIVAREKNISSKSQYEGTYTSHNEYKRIEYLKKDSKEGRGGGARRRRRKRRRRRRRMEGRGL
jgi:hypothetical protein